MQRASAHSLLALTLESQRLVILYPSTPAVDSSYLAIGNTGKTPQKYNHLMTILLYQVLFVSAMFNRIYSLPAGLQKVLGTVADENMPDFGVGFDLTASYGYVTLSNIQKFWLLTCL